MHILASGLELQAVRFGSAKFEKKGLNLKLKENLGKEEIKVVYFAVNYLCKCTSEIQVVVILTSRFSTPVLDTPQMIQFHFAH